MKDRVNVLIKLLFDNSASITERDEAATILGEFSDARAIRALLSKAKDLNENELVLNSCGESLGAIWAKQNFFDEEAYHALLGTARYGVYVVIKHRKPEWLEKYHLEEDEFLNKFNK
jgi:hypothetical protein